MANCARPFIFKGVSMRNASVPISLKSEGSLSGTLYGIGSLEAAIARSPYLIFFPVGLWCTIPFSEIHSLFPTFHFCAAASRSISLAFAPALRKGVHKPRMDLLPPVPSDSNACSTLIVDQSRSISSAMIIGNEVHTPCPISDFVTLKMT